MSIWAKICFKGMNGALIVGFGTLSYECIRHSCSILHYYNSRLQFVKEVPRNLLCKCGLISRIIAMCVNFFMLYKWINGFEQSLPSQFQDSWSLHSVHVWLWLQVQEQKNIALGSLILILGLTEIGICILTYICLYKSRSTSSDTNQDQYLHNHQEHQATYSSGVLLKFFFYILL